MNAAAEGPIGLPADAARRATVTVGMAVTLGALTMTFAALLLAYGIVRSQAPAWPPPGEPPLPPLWGWRAGATIAALVGSVALWSCRNSGEARREKLPALAVAAVAGLTFLALQLGSLQALAGAGIKPSSGIVASVVYALTLFHGLHALVALLFLAPALFQAARGGRGHLGALAAFWHLVTGVWVVIFLAVFVA
jgi:heme/copper-type cytochrome/quinol oxidase subunit 3